MAASDRIVGSNVVVHFLKTGDTAGVDEKVLSADFTSFSYDRSTDTADVTAGNETTRYRKATIEDLTFTIMLFDADPTWLPDVQPQQTGKLSVYKEGTGSSNPVIEFNCLLTGFSEEMPFDGALEIEISGERLGDMVSEIGSTA